jgi:hypothetical protein
VVMQAPRGAQMDAGATRAQAINSQLVPGGLSQMASRAEAERAAAQKSSATAPLSVFGPSKLG